MSRCGLRLLAAMAILAAAGATTGLAPVLASSWWTAAPGDTSGISQLASSPGAVTLVVSHDEAALYRPSAELIEPLRLPSGSRPPGPAQALAANGQLGVIGFASGELLEVDLGSGESRWLPAPGVSVRDLAIGRGSRPELALGSSAGLYFGVVGGPLREVARGSSEAVLAPSRSGLSWLALLSGRLWRASSTGLWRPLRSAPPFGASTRALSQLANGAVLVGEQSGLVWRGLDGSWTRVFQVLPQGGLAGVPELNAMVSVGSSSAYLATSGFGTLLTPDAGFTWYMAAPPAASVTELAAVGPVSTARAHGLVLALSPGGLFLHRLQSLPGPAVYTPRGQLLQLVGTTAVTLAAALLALTALWLMNRRRRSRRLSSEGAGLAPEVGREMRR